MNVVEEHQPNCLVTLHVEVPVDRVNRQWDEVVNEFKKFASLQGYRKGAAPRKLVESRFAKEIQQELQKKLLDTSLQEAIQSKGLNVISILGFENIELAKNTVLRYSAKVATAPTFEVPDYTSIELEIPAPVVTEKELNDALEYLRAAFVNYEPVENRGLEMGDMAVVTYFTKVDGHPSLNIPDLPKRLVSGSNFWIELEHDALLPGFSEALMGMRPGEVKNFELLVAMEHPVESLRGKTIAFETTLEEINQKHIPEWSDELANRVFEGKTFEELKELMRKRLEDRAKHKFEIHKRQGIIDHLLSQVQAEVPSHLVQSETNRVLKEIIKERQASGVGIDQLLQQEQEIVGFAEKSAQNRVLGAFLLFKIAEKENIQVTEEDVSKQLIQLAESREISIPKLIKELNKNNAFQIFREDILFEKTLSFVASKVTVREPVVQLEGDGNIASNA